MLSKTNASAGLAATAVTVGMLFMNAPASAQDTAVPTHVSAAAARVSTSAPYDDGWWWHHRHFRHHRHHFRHRFRDFDDFGSRRFNDFDSRGFGGFGGDVNRNINVVSNNIGISNSNTNVAIAHGQ